MPPKKRVARKPRQTQKQTQAQAVVVNVQAPAPRKRRVPKKKVVSKTEALVSGAHWRQPIYQQVSIPATSSAQASYNDLLTAINKLHVASSVKNTFSLPENVATSGKVIERAVMPEEELRVRQWETMASTYVPPSSLPAPQVSEWMDPTTFKISKEQTPGAVRIIKG